MKNCIETYEVTQHQVDAWADSGQLYPDSDERAPWLIVMGVRDTFGSFYVQSEGADNERDAVDRARELDEWGMTGVAQGDAVALSPEVWRVVDVPEDGIAYVATADTLSELLDTCDILESVFLSLVGDGTDPYVYGSRSVTGSVRDLLEASVGIRRIVRDLVGVSA